MNYFKSKNIRVFPCSFRGNFEVGSGSSAVTYGFDPEARLSSEFNYTHAGRFTGNSGASYIVEWDAETSTPPGNVHANILKCVIGGYYFEIGNCSLAKPDTDSSSTTTWPTGGNVSLFIKTRSITLRAQQPDSGTVLDSQRETEVLAPFDGAVGAIVDQETATGSGIYEFKALCYDSSANTDLSTHTSLQIIKNGVVNYEAFLPKVTAGSSSDNSAVQIGAAKASGKNSFAAGKAVADWIDSGFQVTATMSPAMLLVSQDCFNYFGIDSKLKINDIIYTVTGPNYPAMPALTLSPSPVSHVQSGDHILIYSALGANHENSAVFGEGTETGCDNQVVVGQYNIVNDSALFVVGSGQNDSPANALTVSQDTTQVYNNLQVDGAATVGGAVNINNNLQVDGVIHMTTGSITTGTNSLTVTGVESGTAKITLNYGSNPFIELTNPSSLKTRLNLDNLLSLTATNSLNSKLNISSDVGLYGVSDSSLGICSNFGSVLTKLITVSSGINPTKAKGITIGDTGDTYPITVQSKRWDGGVNSLVINSSGTTIQGGLTVTKSTDTDDEDLVLTGKKAFYDLVYPVGSIYITERYDFDPNQSFFGYWVLLESGYFLQSEAASTTGEYIEAGLPNITGGFGTPSEDSRIDASVQTRPDGAFDFEAGQGPKDSLFDYGATDGRYQASYLTFSAQNSNPIYGRSTTVQPPAYTVRIWRRVG